MSLRRRRRRRDGLPATAPPAWTEPPPDPPELPEAIDPRWSAWWAPVALIAGFTAASVAIAAIFVPIVLLDESSFDESSITGWRLLLLVSVQDVLLVGTAVLCARFTVRPRAWQFGMRSTRFWRTAGIGLLVLVLLVGFEIAYFSLLGGDGSNTDDLGAEEGLLQAIAVCIAVIVVAPVTEEFFFRGFFYRALRNRMRVRWAALIDGLVFGAIHLEPAAFPVLALVGVGLCLVYEWTGSLFIVIAMHAAFNTFAMLGYSGEVTIVAVIVGTVVLLGCLVASWRLGPAPSPLRGAASRRPRLADGPPAIAPPASPPAISPASG